MNNLNYIFFEEFKKLEKLCGEMYGSHNGVTNYTNFDTNSTLFYYDSVNKKTIADNMLEAKDVKAFVIKNAGICGGKIINKYSN